MNTQQRFGLYSTLQHSSRTTWLTLMTFAAGVALLAIFTAQSSEPNRDAARVNVDSKSAHVESASAPIEYFPAQYRNSAQNGLPEQHIQAF